MIKQILERDFVIKSAKALEIRIGGMIAQAEDGGKSAQIIKAQEVELDDLRQALEELKSAIKREENSTPEQENGNNYIPCNPIISLLQTSLQHYCEEKQSKEVLGKSKEIKALANDDNIPGAVQELTSEMIGFLSDDSPAKAFNDFENLDAGWLNCVFSIAVRNWRKPHPFNHKPADHYEIKNNDRVILFSDWGSGLPRAQKVTKQIRLQLDDPSAAHRNKHLIHLGDVYYSGWAAEYEKNLLPYWSVREDEADKITSWALNSNHEMYSGGSGYFDFLLNSPRFKRQQKSSFFSLGNDHWQLLGLDTGYHENRLFDPHDLYGKQDEWVYETLKNAPDKKGILMSHHQPFSAFASGGEKLLAKLRQPLDEGLIHTWFWGHEHRCTLYEKRENIKFPRCIGHGGIPFYVETDAYPPGVQYEYREGFDHFFETWNYFGFVVLDFDDDKITVRYINELGNEHYTETIQ